VIVIFNRSFSAAALCEMSYEDPYIETEARLLFVIEFVLTQERNETSNVKCGN